MIHTRLIRRIVLIAAIFSSVGGAAFGYRPAKITPDPVYLPAVLDSIVGLRWDSAHNDYVPGTGKWNYEYNEDGVLLSQTTSNWDSDKLLWNRGFRTLFAYDSVGRYVQQENYKQDEFTVFLWVKLGRQLLTYDSSSRLIEVSSYGWETSSNKWINRDRREYVFDTLGNLVEESTYQWYQDRQDWYKDWLQQFTYDSAGNLAEELTFYGDGDFNIWIRSERIQHFHDSAGILTETRYSYWNLKEYITSSIVHYTYDTEGYKIGEVSTSWREENKEWVPDRKMMYNYTLSGDLAGEYTSYWDEESEQWYWSRHQQYTYDSSGNLTGEFPNTWNDSTGEWIPLGIHWAGHFIPFDGGYFYEYDAYGYQSAREWKDYDSESKEWINHHKDFYYWSFLHDSMVMDQFVELDENSTGPLRLGSMQTGSEYARDSMTFIISEGDPDHLFSLDSISGELFLNPSGMVDYEEVTAYDLIIEAHLNDSARVYEDLAHVTIRVNNLNDNPPVVHDTTFQMDESVDHVTVARRHIGNLWSMDPDGDLGPLYHTIVDGDEPGNFYLNPSKAALYVWHQTVDYEVQDSYSLEIEVSDGLFTSQAVVTILVNDLVETPVGDAIGNKGILIYPNPASDNLLVEFSRVPGKDTRFEIRDATGRVRVSTLATGTPTSSQVCQLDLSSLEKGIYYISVISGDIVTTKKIIRLE